MNSTANTSTIVVQRLLDQLRSGNQDASRQLLDVTMDRLRNLSRKILADRPHVERWEEMDDLVQNSSLRLWKVLEKHHPPTPLDYFRLAAAVIRRELIDLSRRHFGPMGLGANLAKSWLQSGNRESSPIDLVSDGTNDPVDLRNWTELHEYIDNLPLDEQTMFDLLWYQGLTLSDAAEASGTPERTLRRRWRSARINLYRTLMTDRVDDHSPPLD